jgi:hypothetical protein
MDTITLGWWSGIAPQQVVDFALSNGKRQKGKPNGLFRSKKGYHNDECLWVRDRYFHFAWHPKYPKMHWFTLTTHLSAYKNWDEFIELIYLLFQGEDVLEKAEIKRLDLAVDIAIPYTEVFKCLQRTNSKRVTEISSKERTTYFGRAPDELAIYERVADPDKVDFWHPKAEWTEQEQVECVRFENRLYGKKVPFLNTSQVAMLWDRTPFSRVQLREPVEGIIQPFPQVKTKQLESFLYRAEFFGFDAVRKEENRRGDFEKRIGKHLGPLAIDLQQAWLNRLERFGVPKPQTLSDMSQNPIPQKKSEVYSALQS